MQKKASLGAQINELEVDEDEFQIIADQHLKTKKGSFSKKNIGSAGKKFAAGVSAYFKNIKKKSNQPVQESDEPV